MKKYTVFMLGMLVVVGVAGCAKVFLTNEKEAGDTIYAAGKSIDTANDSDVNLPRLLDQAEDELSEAKRDYNREKFTKALELAQDADKKAKDALSLPTDAKNAIEEGDKKLAQARESGIELFFVQDFRTSATNLREAHENYGRKLYDEARSLANIALAIMQKDFDEFNKATNAITDAKTALVTAKEAKADELVPDFYNDARDTLSEAQASMEEHNLVQAVSRSAVAKDKAEKAAIAAKEKSAPASKSASPAPVPSSPAPAQTADPSAPAAGNEKPAGK